METPQGPETGQLTARPRPFAEAAWPLPPGIHPLGIHPLGLGDGRDGLLRVPSAPIAGPLPLILMLHGAGSEGARALHRIAPIADAALILAPDSLGQTWDVLMGGFGPDVARLDAALSRILAAWPIDPTRLAIAGFSDGASYALSLALMNGGLFSHGIGFSPGFVAPLGFSDRRAPLFVSHGTEDRVLSIAHCSRRFVPQLGRAGFDVTYVEFAGGHELPPAIAHRALAFLNGAEA